jgi:hypothetical protein
MRRYKHLRLQRRLAAIPRVAGALTGSAGVPPAGRCCRRRQGGDPQAWLLIRAVSSGACAGVRRSEAGSAGTIPPATTTPIGRNTPAVRFCLLTNSLARRHAQRLLEKRMGAFERQSK